MWESGGCLKPEYQMQHNVASDISRCHAKREGQTTETDEQTQRIAKQDEKEEEDIQKREESHNQKQTRRTKQDNTDRKTSHTHNQSRKPKTIYMKKKPRASAAKQGARRAWLISDAKSFGFHGFRWIHGFCLWLSLPWDCLVLIGFDG